MEFRIQFPDGRQVDFHKLIEFLYGITDSEMNILHLLLYTDEKLTVEDISERLKIAKTSISKPVNILLTKGLIMRDKVEGESKRRPKYLYYTDKSAVYNKVISDLDAIAKIFCEKYKSHIETATVK
ncbi:MarR family transcriptional regulator [Acidianus sp. HS-5]|uniref:MarR family transcriptional regulator n=1 Tax=Acidianus sp. HS-5 TaxID=2886040 RepID=UPI001F023FFA|nr:MarR family transcriptional regulator [Acidianus sp. HS-5]BDC17828.1 transcriptional regulator [Acidianus sp. HS-5]